MRIDLHSDQITNTHWGDFDDFSTVRIEGPGWQLTIFSGWGWEREDLLALHTIFTRVRARQREAELERLAREADEIQF